MPQQHRDPILVTGAIRSGTTWVGRVLGASREIGLIEEPFNVAHRRGIFAADLAHQYTYLAPPEDERILRALADALTFRYRPRAQLRWMRTFPHLAGFVRDWPKTLWWRHFSRPRPLLKDPIALFSAERLARRFGMRVVVMIRHPAAFAWSYKRIGEPNRFGDLTAQPTLMRDLLAPYADALQAMRSREADPIDQAILLWNIVYHVVDDYRRRHADWIFVRHEDLALDPVAGFRELCERLDLAFSAPIRARLARFNASGHPAEAAEGVRHDLRRNSRELVGVWRRRLTAAEIERVRDGTREIAGRYYPASSWD